MIEKRDKTQKLSRWYFGGLASSAAACITHPLDLIKVHLQTQQEKKMSFYETTREVIKKGGASALYTGLTASLLRQLTYATTRLGMYEVGKQNMRRDTPLNRILLACFAGLCGGFVGTPADLVNVRMQNDIKLPPDKRRNYKNAIDGLIRVFREEGLRRMFSGASAAIARAVLMTAGQLTSYDYSKKMLLGTKVFIDNMTTHLISSIFAGICATLLTQPVDVIKTRMMNAKPGEFKGMLHIVAYTAQAGPTAFFKGMVPSGTRILPFNILLFIFYEQLRLNFGFYPIVKTQMADKKKEN